jgi:hypothetical protein
MSWNSLLDCALLFRGEVKNLAIFGRLEKLLEKFIRFQNMHFRCSSLFLFGHPSKSENGKKFLNKASENCEMR